MKLFILSSLLIVSFIAADQQSFPESWEQQTFPQQWVKLNRDRQGYMIYNPCEGSTPGIILHKDTLHMYWQLESQTHLIKSFEKIDHDHYKINCYGVVTQEGDIIYGVSARQYYIKVLNRKHKLVEWLAIAPDAQDTVKWMMSPEACRKDFRIVNQKCEPNMKTKADPEVFDY